MQVRFHVDNRLVALLPDCVNIQLFHRQLLGQQNFRMYAHDQHFFIIRTIEDSDSSAFGQALIGPPQKVVIQIGGTWMLETEHLAPLRVDTTHDMANGAIFACRIHGQKNQQEAVTVRRVVHLLKMAEFFHLHRQQFAVILTTCVVRFYAVHKDILLHFYCHQTDYCLSSPIHIRVFNSPR